MKVARHHEGEPDQSQVVAFGLGLPSLSELGTVVGLGEEGEEAKIKSVTVTPQNIQMQTISKEVIPTPRRIIAGQNVETSGEETKNYGTELYPSAWFDYQVGCGLYHRELSIIVNVQIYPIKYHPIEKIIEWVNEVNIVVEYEPSIPTPQATYSDNFQLVVIGPSDYSEQAAPLNFS